MTHAKHHQPKGRSEDEEGNVVRGMIGTIIVIGLLVAAIGFWFPVGGRGPSAASTAPLVR